MAKVKFIEYLDQVVGALGKLTFARNKAGAYTKPYVIPTDPKTTEQMTSRENFKTVTQNWAGLTEQQRADWTQFGIEHPEPNAFGELKQISGIAAFTRSNLRLISYGYATISNAPTSWDLIPLQLSFLDCKISSEGPAGWALQFTGDDTDETPNKYIMYVTPPISAGISDFTNYLVYSTKEMLHGNIPFFANYPDTIAQLKDNDNIGVLIYGFNSLSGARRIYFNSNINIGTIGPA